MSNNRRNKKKSQRRQNTASGNRMSQQHSVHSTQATPHPDMPKDTLAFEGSERIHYLENLSSKQLELYNWCEEKVTTLATIDAILLAGATLFVEHIKAGDFPKRMSLDWFSQVLTWIENSFPVIMILVILLPIFVSLGITLWHVIPKMRSGATSSRHKNHRSSVGIQKFLTKEDYKLHLDSLSFDDIYRDLVWQIYGMNKNIWKNQNSIKVAVVFDLIGLSGFLLVVLYLVFNGQGTVIFN